MLEWTCLQSKPAEETKAKRWIEDRGHEVYLPLVRERRGAIRPLFPRYLFVVLDERWPELESLPGVAHVLRDGERPARLRLVIPGRKRRNKPALPSRVINGDDVIMRIKSMAGPDGIIVPPRESRYVREPFERGQILRVRDIWHVLHGRDLTFVGMRSSARVLVMLSWFGANQTVHLEQSLIEAVGI
jgi:Transcription termination factor nusG